MPFSTTYSRTKTFSNGGTLLPGDLNSIQDDLGQQLAGVNQVCGVNEGSNVRRGKSQIATTEVISSASYTTATTPDHVNNIVLPANGLIVVGFQALWQNSVAGAARAAIFLGSNQLKIASTTGAPVVAEATGPTDVTDDNPISTYSGGLISSSTGAGSSTEVTTGQVVGAYSDAGAGGVCYIFANVGTYIVSVQYKSATGTVTVKNRHLWVWTVNF